MTNEQLATKLSELIDKGVETIPPYIADLIDRYATYAVCINLLGAVVFWGIIIAIIIAVYKKFKDIMDYECIIGAILFGIILLLIPAILCTITLFKAIFVPEVLLLELV